MTANEQKIRDALAERWGSHPALEPTAIIAAECWPLNDGDVFLDTFWSRYVYETTEEYPPPPMVKAALSVLPAE